MELSNINSVNDLVAANNEPVEKSPLEAAQELVFLLPAPEALELLKETVAQLAIWHQNNAQSADTVSESAAWAVDEGRLHICLLALKEVTF
jgi:phosphoribosylaminoimidazole carboxylase (NCAIR synthetase)